MTASPPQPRLIEKPKHVRAIADELAFLERRIDEVSSALNEMTCADYSAPPEYRAAHLALSRALLSLRGKATDAAEELSQAQGEYESQPSEGGR